MKGKLLYSMLALGFCLGHGGLSAQGLTPINPLLDFTYAADPSAHVFHDTLWVYPSHDKADAKRFDMEDYHVYSTTDMVHWQNHGIIFRPFEQTTWAKEAAWAPDCVERDGKFYLYYPTDKRHIGVAVSNRPDGPFVDPLGHPLLSIDSPGVVCDRDFIDPCVFIDDDGRAYMYVGQNTPCCIKLNSDMTSYDGEVHLLEGIPEFFEAAWMHKEGSTYYFSYSDGPFHGHQPRISYCTADNPLGPFTYRGVILDPVNSGTNHHSIVQYRGQWWLFYHTSDLSLYNAPFDHTGVRRSLAADPLFYSKDGAIQKVTPSHDKRKIQANQAAPQSGNVHLVSGRIPVSGGGYLYYDETVSANPGPKETVVLLHGHSLDRRMWDEQLPALTDRYHVVRIDLRGYGLSSDQEEEQPFLHAEDVITVLDSLQLNQVHVVGLSMGAFIAGDLLAIHPDRLITCTLASGGIRETPGPDEPIGPEESAKRDQEIQRLRQEGIDNYKKKWIETLMHSGGTQRERIRKPLTRMVEEWTAWQPLHKEARYYYARQAWKALKEKRPNVPTLLLHGANEHRSRSKMLDYLPQGQQTEIPDCGHLLNMEQPEAFNRVLLDFLQHKSLPDNQ